MIEQWQELKETIIEMRDNDGTGTQQEICKFLANYMDILEKQMQEPCEDAISRQAVQDYIAKYLSQYLYNDVREAVEVIDEYIGELSSVNPTKTGHWIFVDKAHEHAHCSECDYGDVDLLDGRPHNYCPNCGVRIVEPQERSDKEC